eukprot:Ihof_evm6s198 gene=Ihof_evmTU6s198
MGQGGVPRNIMIRNIISVTFMTFVIESSRGLFIASLWGMVLYVGDGKELNSFLVSIFSVGRMVATLVCGYAVDHFSEKRVNIFFCVLGVISNILYLTCYKEPFGWLLVMARIGAGISTGPLSAMRSHTAKITTNEQRTKYMALNGVAQFAGVGLSPIIALTVAHMNFEGKLPPSIAWLLGPLTAPATILIFLNLVNILVQMFLFVDIPKTPVNATAEEIAPLLPEGSNTTATMEQQKADEEARLKIQDKLSNENDKDWQRLVFMGIWLYMIINFSARAVLALIEAVGTPVYLKMIGHAGDVKASTLLFSYLGLGGLAMFGVTIILIRYINEVWLLISGFVCLLLGGILVATAGQTNVYALILAFCLIWSVGFPLLSTTIISSFSKVLGSKPQGGMMGWIGTAGSLGRIVMPMLASVMSSAAVFSLVAMASLASIVLVLMYMYAVKRHMAT